MTPSEPTPPPMTARRKAIMDKFKAECDRRAAEKPFSEFNDDDLAALETHLSNRLDGRHGCTFSNESAPGYLTYPQACEIAEQLKAARAETDRRSFELNPIA